ncbi:major facilitator superfamily domain-containing protein [Kockovaella imperatae]|uniref:Major facilitator superfamily domain-containing protein n=1 Tax=Kockovaella imperatae TaxID=4999 RepID=A0A1Y1UAG6_9TREE|nr:major facilitator superfamily domain-containing protein [Kockovaella imperatae]ORX34486.1 major facilitator superfamily domain-containing protein [Kockovaella imperatae]
MTASYGLTLGMFLIASGRLGDLYGPKLLWLLGTGLMAIFNLGTGFCQSRIPFDLCRALAGIGAALAVPNAVAILGRTYPPGSTRSLIFAIFGALAPVGFMVGGAVAALLAQTTSVIWIWFFTAILAAVILVLGIFVLPPDANLAPASARRSFDYVGTLLLIVALGLFNFTWNQGPVVAWSAPYVWSLLLVSMLAFVALYFWEKRLGTHALIPTEVLSRTSLLVYLCLWLGWMSFGVFLFYTTLFIRNVRGVDTALGLTAQLIPVTPTGVICALAVPTLLTRFPGHQIFFVSMVAFLVGDVMGAVAPVHGYWSVTFPSLILVILGPDLSYSTGQLIVSNSVDRQFQGTAGGIVSMITNYSLSIGLGMAGTVEAYVVPNGPVLKGYRTAFYFGSGLAALAVVVVGLFVRMPKMTQYRE